MSKIFPAPDGPWPAGKAWYPLLGQFGPAQSSFPDDFDPWDPAEPLFPPVVPADSWKTREGKIIRISDLETSHLRNIIRMIEREGGGPGCLVKIQEKNERVRNLLDEWLKRF